MRSLNVLKSLCYVLSLKKLCIDDLMAVFIFSFPLRCLKFLGSRHPTLVLPLVPELLSTHPYFDTPEPDMDDPACILHIPENLFKKHLCSCRHATSTSFCSGWTKSESLHTSCPVHFIHQPLWFGCTANCTWAVFLFLIPHFSTCS